MAAIALLLVVALSVVATLTTARLHTGNNKSGGDGERFTVLSCSFPDSFLAFSLFRYNASTDTTAIVDLPDGVNTAGQNFNAQYSARHGYTYTTDTTGAINIRTTRTNITVAKGPTLNDHARWCPARKRLLFTSTREANPVPNQGWNAVYVAEYEGTEGKLSEPVRLTPQGMTDYSPAWGPHDHDTPPGVTEAYIAVASGFGAPGGTDIVVMAITENGTVTKRWTAAKNGGWPTWYGRDVILFHRIVGPTVGDWSIIAVNITSSEERVVVANGLTPTVSDTATPATPSSKMAYAYIDENTGFRQIAVRDLLTNVTQKITSDPTHHYNPYHDPETGDVLFHKCRGGEYPTVRRRISGRDDLDLAFVAGDFPSMSPDGTRLAMIYANYNYFLSVDVSDADGANRRTVYNATHAWMTSWRNNQTIAFTSGSAFALTTDGHVQVSTVDATTGEVSHLTSDANANQGYPSYSPDGASIVYRTSISEANTTAIINGESIPTAPSPPLPGPYHLRLMNYDGSNQRPLTTLPANCCAIGDQHPNWGHPDYIVFTSDRGHQGQMSIWRIHRNGTDLKEIFNHGANSVHPAFVPGRNRIVFTTTIAAHSMEEVAWPFTFFPQAELWEMDLDGNHAVRLTHDASNQANAFVGRTPLPKELSTTGRVTSCRYQDSTDPMPAATLRSQRGSKGESATQAPGGCPFAQAASAPSEHAVVRAHGIRSVVTSPKDRKMGCPFLRRQIEEADATGADDVMLMP